MKGNVFIGWNIDNVLAKKVKEKLRTYDYNGIVGGKDGNAVEHGVGATIIKQMKSCCSAIMLFSVRNLEYKCKQCDAENEVGILSGNMLYELGYLTGSLRIKRVFTIYIDNASNYAPSDLKGAWDLKVSTNEKTTDEIANEIVEIFIAEQAETLTANKMDLITDISKIRSTLIEHIQSPVYYEGEIAQICILFCQSAYMFDDMKNSADILKDLLHSGEEDESCLLAINSCLDYFTACDMLVPASDGVMTLPAKAYNKLSSNFLDYISDAEQMPDSSFKFMFLMVVYDYLSFINMMRFSGNDEGDDEYTVGFREDCCKKSIEYAKKFRELDADRNSQVSTLYECYTFRNLALFYRSKNRNEEAQKYFEKSTNARRDLLKYFKFKDLNKSILEQVKMEYYLSLVDNIFEVGDVEKSKRVRELKLYIEEVEEISYNRQFFAEKIKKILKEIDNKK